MADYTWIHAAYIRTASTVVGVYEYLRMFPTAVNFYSVQCCKKRISLPLVLFVLIRLTSITLLTVSNYAFFYPHFTPESCSKFYLGGAVLKVFQIMVSQCIMGVRAYNLSGRSKRVGAVLLALYVTVCVVQWMAMVYHTYPALYPHGNNPTAVQASCFLGATEDGFGPWVFYAVALTFDLAVTIICGYHLIKYKRMVTASFLSKMMNAIIYDGLAYFVGLTAVNIVNLILLQSPKSSVQIMGVSVAYVLVWVLSQHIVLGQYRAHERRVSSAHVNVNKSSQPPRPHLPSTLEVGPPEATFADSSDRDGSRTVTDTIQMKTLMTIEDDGDSLRMVTQERMETPYPDSVFFANSIQLPIDEEDIERRGIGRTRLV